MSHMWVSLVTHMSESCHTYEWVMSHMNAWVMSHMHLTRWGPSKLLPCRFGCDIQMIEFVNESCHTCQRFMSHMHESSCILPFRVWCSDDRIRGWVMSHISMHVIYAWVIVHIAVSGVMFRWQSSWMIHVTHFDSCHICMSHRAFVYGMSYMDRSCHVRLRRITYDRVMSHMKESCHTWMSHVHMKESCHIWMSYVTCEWDMSHMNESYHISLRRITYGWLGGYG